MNVTPIDRSRQSDRGLERNLTGRKILLLQGPSSRFFIHLGKALHARGADVARLGVAPGDRVLWSRAAGAYHAFRGPPEAFPGFLADLIAAERISDMVMLGDGRFYHDAALEVARSSPERPHCWIVEHGYLRPGLISIEPQGMGGNSRIPSRFETAGRTPEAKSPETHPPDVDFPASFLRYAAGDLAFNLSNLACAWARYPGYRPHTEHGVMREYGGWLKRLVGSPGSGGSGTEGLDWDGPVFLFPLQLPHDYQLRRYGTGQAHVADCARVVTSFAEQAPAAARLIVKTHPMDNALTPWPDIVSDLRAQTGLGARLVLSQAGTVPDYLGHLSGLVTVNSSAGLAAVCAGVPTKVLGRAIYDLPGLTHAGALRTFWATPAAPDPATAARFEQFLRANFHVPGAFDGPGAQAGAENLADWLVDPPPAAGQEA